jgi:predicted transposase YdaD
MKKPKPYDQAFKYLAEQDPTALLILLGALKPEQKVTIELLPNEVTVSAKLPDSVYLVKTKNEPSRIIHIEAQTEYDPKMPRRMTDYALRLWIKYNLAVESYLLLLTPRKVPQKIPDKFQFVAGSLAVRLHYQVISIWEVSARKALAFNKLDLLPFIPLMKGGHLAIADIARAIENIDDDQRQRELDLHFVILSGLRYTQHEFLEFLGSANMIPITYELAKQSSTFRAMVKDVKQEARGEGRAEGRTEAFAELLKKLAAQRFPDLAIGSQLDQIRDAEALEQLCLQVGTIKNSKLFLQQISQLVETSKQPKVKKNGTSKK